MQQQQQEYIININMDMEQESAGRFFRMIERHFSEGEMTVKNKNVDESWGSIAFHTDKPLQNINNAVNYILNNATRMNLKVESDIQIHTPQILIGLSQLEAKKELFEGLDISYSDKDAEISFKSTKQRDDFLNFINNEKIEATKYFSDKQLEVKNNYSTSKKFGM